VPLRREVSRTVRRYRPEIVITNNLRDTWDGAVLLNQADHIASGRAVLDGVRYAGNRWVFPDLLDEDLEPWGGVRQVWAAGSPRSKHGVDVTGTFGTGVARGTQHVTAHVVRDPGRGPGSSGPTPRQLPGSGGTRQHLGGGTGRG